MQLIDSYPLSPGCCRVCRSSAHLPTIDTLQDIDEAGYEGRFYICIACATELGDMVGMLSPDRADKLKKEATRWRKKADQERANLDAAREFVVEAFTADAVEDEDAA